MTARRDKRGGRVADPPTPVTKREDFPYGERLAALEVRQEQFATKEDIQKTKLWFVLSSIGGILALLSLVGTLVLIVLRFIN